MNACSILMLIFLGAIVFDWSIFARPMGGNSTEPRSLRMAGQNPALRREGCLIGFVPPSQVAKSRGFFCKPNQA